MNSQANLYDNILFARNKIIYASKKGAKLILLPENCFLMAKNNKQFLEFVCTEINHPGLNEMKKIAKKLGVWIIIGSVNIKEKKKIFNRSILIDDKGKTKGRYNKIHLFSAKLPNKEFYDEKKFFTPGKKVSVLNLPWGRIGMTICYDLRFPHLHRKLAKKGAAFISVPSAFTKFTGELHWHTLLKARAIETGCYIFAPAQSGTHPGNKKTYGHTLIVDPWGKIINECKNKSTLIISEIDTKKVIALRNSIPSLKLERFF
jgi:predicted amidohydrolase